MAGVLGIVLSRALRDIRALQPRAVQPPQADLTARLPALQDPSSTAEHSLPSPAEPPPAVTGEAAPSEPLYTAQALRDPFDSLLLKQAPAPEPPPQPVVDAASVQAPAVPPPVSPPSVVLQGIVWGGPEPLAIINHQVFRLGQTVGGSKIVRIDRQGVTLDVNGTPVVYGVASSP
jgi:hypothetical protein